MLENFKIFDLLKEVCSINILWNNKIYSFGLIQYDSNNCIQFIELTVNKGCYYSKNIALKNINPKTKYIAFQDSDDISLVSRISKQYSHNCLIGQFPTNVLEKIL